ncbi:reverse transcriptase [Flavobacterium oncorhynchi]|uniref:RNA-directed DNA polymerase n=1 Tax=Flavobacterium oncorhynchi TaxID=728056 RepID=A0A226HXI7_9FLAO|nr:reverse transcriptase domain-containing protein [Flavobacterium oncorhynchi]OXA98959.1 reverse transcriptase [Flavobacterium oncorhynchi]
MDFDQYKTEFATLASSVGYTEQNIQKCLKYAKPLLDKKLPVIYNTSNLSNLVGYKKEYLKKAVRYTSSYYRDFEITKNNGGKRKISEPLPSLKEIQIWILDNILSQIEISPYAKAYRQNVTLIENLKFHKNQPKVFTIDLENFFTTIKQDSIQKIFGEMGYSRLISNLLSKLCTRDDSLPQGAPTSPYLSNIFFKSLDIEITKYCNENKIRYTRYADDLSFSGDFDEKILLEFVTEKITKAKLVINPDKVKLMKKNTRQIVTGIVVNEKMQVVFHKRNKIRQDMFYIKKYGLVNHMEHLKIKKNNYLEHLIGKINFILHINPNDKEFIDYKSFLNDLKNKVNKTNA